jgi:hypothetical protein
MVEYTKVVLVSGRQIHYRNGCLLLNQTNANQFEIQHWKMLQRMKKIHDRFIELEEKK